MALTAAVAAAERRGGAGVVRRWRRTECEDEEVQASTRTKVGRERTSADERRQSKARGGVGSEPEPEPELWLETEMRIWDRSRPASH